MAIIAIPLKILKVFLEATWVQRLTPRKVSAKSDSGRVVTDARRQVAAPQSIASLADTIQSEHGRVQPQLTRIGLPTRSELNANRPTGVSCAAKGSPAGLLS